VQQISEEVVAPGGTGLSVAFSEEQRALQATAKRFAREKLAPAYQARERQAAIDRTGV
jgi:alkylation response protein AidB-like acyl-CoA dehydrogenase